jgi:DNA topoisomerase-1
MTAARSNSKDKKATKRPAKKAAPEAAAPAAKVRRKAAAAVANGKADAKAAAVAEPAKAGRKAAPRKTAGSGYLVVVESPSKAKTIKKYLGRNFTVKASVGHVKDLPKSKLGVDPDHGFATVYEVMEKKVKVMDDIKKAANASEMTYLATDPDREGEAIAWDIAEEMDKGVRVQRVLFNEITKKAVQEAIQHPLELDRRKFDSQRTRRILDRLVGYQISPILWTKVRRGLSAGRVQSVAVRLIVEREAEIDAFVAVEYWTLDADLSARLPPNFLARLTRLDGVKAEIGNGATSEALVAELQKATWTVSKVDRKERRRNPPAPFITSKLQQEAANRLHFTAKKTMTLAQRLYEGVELGPEGSVGLISYMRTDSVRLSADAVTEARKLIGEKYGPEYVPAEPNVFKSKKAAQDAHEAIRPTSLEWTPERVQPFVDADMFRLYELIWRRFLACQMAPAVYDQTSIDIAAGRAAFRATGTILKFSGYLAVYGLQADEGEDKSKGEEDAGAESTKELPPVEAGETLTLNKLLPEQHFTQPPPRFTEASLVKELEEKGIGRPSTYAAILSVIQDKEYVTKVEGRFYPTELGTLVTGLLVKSFPGVIDATFTAGLEEKLDEIAEGNIGWVKVLEDFYAPFKLELAKASEQMRDVKREEISTELKCEKCGSPMVIKWGRRGSFLACSGYPACKNTMDYRKDEEGHIFPVPQEVISTDEICEKCGAPMVVKTGRFGRFIACSRYPDCKSSKPFTIGVGCPECKVGKLTERRSRRGKNFYGCNRYPECTFAAWDKPIAEACPECGSPFLLEKYSKKDGAYIACPKSGKNGTCTYRRTKEEAGEEAVPAPPSAPPF